ncbi:hypothetical protein [Thermomonospora amylolytica]|uniref:hypothetical protein n=1 Tax=Thermomonospora amylolytica TaxID=1411117 RepID=UPI001300ADEA|nr:hypothetical protein [Thermomonospora amylolytica]
MALHGVAGAEVSASDPRVPYLEALRRCLEQFGGGLGVSLVHGPVVLRVTYPYPARPPEDIACVLEEGEWWFAWSDGRTIGPADDPEGVARVIVRDPWRGQA